jgi:hypothetical protein
MTEQLPPHILYDKRLIDRHIAKGLITRKDLENRAAEAEDLTDQADFTSLDELMRIGDRTATSPGPADDSTES